jgi:hypothetical protein
MLDLRAGRRPPLEFRYPYMVAMQSQNPKMYRRLRDSGELDRFVNLKAQEASRIYQSLLAEGPQPPTLMSKREAEERTKGMMFEFPDDAMTAEQDEHKALFNERPPSSRRGMKYSVPDDLPYIMMDDPDPFSSLESLERRLVELQAMPDYVSKNRNVKMLQRIIGIRKAVEAEATPPDGD